jgi:molybdate transport system substrate-binding protein
MIHKHLLRYLFILCCGVLLLSSPARAQYSSPGITILASTSLTEVMTELIRVYTTRSGKTASAFYGSPESLFEDIEGGKSADIYITEDVDRMNKLKQQGLIDVYSLSNIATNTMVLATPFDSRVLEHVKHPTTIKKAANAIAERSLMVIADPEFTPQGQAAKEVLEAEGVWETLSLLAIRTDTTKLSLYLIAKGKHSGVVYHTDALNNPEITVLANLPKEKALTYQAAVVAGIDMQQGREFINFLKSKEAQAIFAKYGFGTVSD